MASEAGVARKPSSRARSYALILAVVWTTAVGASFAWNCFQEQNTARNAATVAARTQFTKDVIFRHWNAAQGCVYVPVSESTVPNPYLTQVEERDIVTPSGKHLTLINPAYMTRQIHELGWKIAGVRSHITSLDPIRPANAPDGWEKHALEYFEQGNEEFISIETFGDKKHLRLMRPLITEQACLKCHAQQGYKEGEIRGGISVSMPMAPYVTVARRNIYISLIGYFGLLLLGLAGIGFGAARVSIFNRKQSLNEMELAQHESEARYRAFFEGSCDAMLLIRDSMFIDCNAATVAMLGYEIKEDLLNIHPSKLSPEFQSDGRKSFEKAAEMMETALAGGTHRFEWDHQRKNGEVFPVEVALTAIQLGDETVLHTAWRDITKRKRAEEKRLELERQIQHAQKLESLGILAGGIAHDFNNLLMAILGNADLALADLSPHAPAREQIREIMKASRRAAELSKQMLAYSGKGRFVIETINLNEFIDETAHLIKASISKKAALKYDFAADLPTFDGDATQIRQIIMNLITNASEALGDESGVIALSTGAMDCDRAYLDDVNEILRAGLDTPLPEGVYVYIEVADTGCGMDKSTIARIFDPFFTTKFTGRGLGMAAVLGIIRGHEGAIRIYSEPGKGTTFKILFPVSEAATGKSAVGMKGRTKNDGWFGSGTILIADDEEMVCTVGKRMLEQLGFSVLTASDGREAVETFREHADLIVGVLLDLTMPHMDGAQVFREMRHLRQDVKVVLCSGYNQLDATQYFAGKGLAGFLQKPYNIAALREKLMEIQV